MSAEEAIRAFLHKAITRREFTQQLRDLGVTAGAAFAFADTLSATCTPSAPMRQNWGGD
jgi:hypothetical protein